MKAGSSTGSDMGPDTPLSSSPLISDRQSGSVTDQPQTISVNDSGLTGIGHLMLNGFTDNSSAESASTMNQQNNRIPSAHTPVVPNVLLDTRPTITPRIASLSAYSTHRVNATPSSPSSSFTYENETGLHIQTRTSAPAGAGGDFSYELVNMADLQLQPSDSAQSKPHPGLHRSNSSAPSRPCKSPLRSTAQTPLSDHRAEISDAARQGKNNTDIMQMDRQAGIGTVVFPDSKISIVVSGERDVSRDYNYTANEELGHQLQRRNSNQSARTIQITTTPLSTLPDMECPPQNPISMPFYILRQIGSSMSSPHGAFVNRSLFVPRATWSQAGVKIPALETKIRVMELLSQNLEIVLKAGTPLLEVETPGQAVSAGNRHATASKSSKTAVLKPFSAALDDFEALTLEIQKILAKKLGDGKNFSKPRKSNGVSATARQFCPHSDEFTRTLSAIGDRSSARRWTK